MNGLPGSERLTEDDDGIGRMGLGYPVKYLQSVGEHVLAFWCA